MSWMQKLFETYERCAGNEPAGADPLMPICHSTQQAHIEIVLSGSGEFKRASVLTDKNNTLIPCTEESAGRAGIKPKNHPLCDKLQYVAGDFVEYGGKVTRGFAADPAEPHNAYLSSLDSWSASDPNHNKLRAIRGYVQKQHVIADLVTAGILPTDDSGKLLKGWEGDKAAAPEIFRAVPPGQSPEDAFVRWAVEDIGIEAAGTWQDKDLIQSWIGHYQSSEAERGCCMVTGSEAALAIQHPAKLRHGGDKAKLISSNDTSGFTFLGRFLSSNEAASVSFDVTQKAHNALRWLVQRQAYRAGDQAIVSWAVSGQSIPDALADTSWLLEAAPQTDEIQPLSDTAQAFALRLSRTIAGYRAKLDATDDIVVMALDSATPGRMSITFYREIKGSEFLSRIEEWHARYAWLQNYGKERRFVGAAAPRDIAEAAYGRRLDDKLRKSTVERLLPCIVDRLPIPRDLIFSVFRRAVNRVSLEPWDWEKCLGIACGLFKGFHSERNYQMALEQDRVSRDYLFGRLLALADNMENYALRLAGESRDTTAARLMQRFADRPASTWRTIEMGLRPYMSRLRSSAGGFLVARERLLDEIVSSFQTADFTSDGKLSPEFLLGFHCQRQLWRSAQAQPGATIGSTETTVNE